MHYITKMEKKSKKQVQCTQLFKSFYMLDKMKHQSKDISER